MRIIWIGDQRSSQIKYWQDVDELQKAEEAPTEESQEEQAAVEYEYILNDQADVSWFCTYAAKKAANLIDLDTAIIVSVGLNDCINSSIWNTLKLETLAANFVTELNTLANQAADCHVYCCLATPVNLDIPRAESATGYVSKDIINNNVVKFNNYIKANSTAKIIDCYGYLNDTSYATRDGLLYTSDVCRYLSRFILNQIKTTTTKFPARLDNRPPTLTGEGEDDQFWTLTSHGGLNEVNGGSDNLNMPYVGCALPNCTSYAWGRFYEITGERPKLLKRNAERWFGYDNKEDRAYTCSTNGKVTDADYKKMAEHGEAGDGYKRGKEPKEGAVICWEGKDGKAGHVAIVEQVNADGSIITSESGWQSAKVWWTTERTNSNGNWGAGSGYIFQGFIYCPAVTPTASSIDVDKADVVVKKGGLTQSEMEINAKYIWGYLGGKAAEPWTLQAVAGILGNMEKESSINPGRHETSGSGFGLVQWTPKSKFTNWATPLGYAEDDIDGQLERIIYEKDNKLQYSKKHYLYTFKEFATSTDSAYTLACAFAFDYERSAVTIWGFHTNTWDRKSVYCKKPTYDSNCETKCKACLPCYRSKFGATRTDQQIEKNRQDLRDARGGAAEKWFKYLLPYAPGSYFEEKFIAENLKLDACTHKSIKASFITSNAKSGKAHLMSTSGKELAKKDLPVAVTEEEPEVSLVVCSFNFDNIEGVKPNKTYKLVVDLDSALTEGETLSLTIEANTPQSLPKQPKITLEAEKSDASFYTDSFKASWNKLTQSEWGFWVGNSKGYELTYYKNGIKLIVEDKNANTDSVTFVPKNKFGLITADDSIQVGVRAWVCDDNDKRVYSDASTSTSESIHFLTKSVKPFLNV